MGFKKEMRTIESIVENVLFLDADSRGNNDRLYYLVCQEYARDRGIAFTNLKFADVLSNRKIYTFPAYESVTRIRRKVQDENPELMPIDKITNYRYKREKQFIEYAHS